MIPMSTHVVRVLSFPILEPHDICLGDLLALLASAGLDTTTVNVNNAACGPFCFQALKLFTEMGLIRDDWATLAYEWHNEISVASGALGITVIDEDIVNL